MVTLDARRAGVSVPRQFTDEPQLNLDFSERFGIADFRYDERGVRASLSFNRQPFLCDVPWSAVYAVFSHVDNERLTWPRSLPQDILEQLPDASVEHLERMLELQVERLLRSKRELHEHRSLPPSPVSLGVEEHAGSAVPSPAATPGAPARPGGSASVEGDVPPKPVPPPTGGRPGLRLIKR